MKTKNLILVLVSIIITSCNTTKEIKQRDLSSIGKNFSESFANLSIKKDSLTHQTTLLKLLKMNDTTKIKDVKLEIQSDGQLKIEYKNTLGEKDFKLIKGKFKKHYYEVFLERNQVVLPPIYWVTNIERLRFSISKDNMLVINEFKEHSGMILFMAAGSGLKYQYYFKNSKK